MVFTKHYPTATAASQAQAHHTWLKSLAVPVPALTARAASALQFEQVSGRHIQPEDLPAAAQLLGNAHATAYRTHLHNARLNEPFHLPGIGWLPDFTAGRTARIRRNLNAGLVPGAALTADQADALLISAAEEPAAFYKDANPRNFLVTHTGIVALDFDDLTLAPFGYDLAKLLLTTAMTYGPLPSPLTDTTLDTYNRATGQPCTPTRLRQWMELHHLLTSPYLGRNGYTHGWDTLRHHTTRTTQ